MIHRNFEKAQQEIDNWDYELKIPQETKFIQKTFPNNPTKTQLKKYLESCLTDKTESLYSVNGFGAILCRISRNENAIKLLEKKMIELNHQIRYMQFILFVEKNCPLIKKKYENRK